MGTVPENKTLTSFQMFTLLVGIVFGTGLFGLPQRMVEIAGRDAWMSVPIAGAALLLSGTLIVFLCRRFPGDNVFEISDRVLGRYLGKVVIVYYVGIGLVGSALIARVYSEIIHTASLIRTPKYLIAALLIAVVANLTRYDVVVLGRYSELVFIALLPLALLPLIQIKGANYLNFLPLGAAGAGKMLLAAVPTLYSFFGYELFVVYAPYLRNRRSEMKVMWAVLLFSSVVYLAVVAAMIGFFGAGRTEKLIWPVLEYLKSIRLPFLDRIEQLFLFLWTQTVFITVGGTLLVAAKGVTYLLKLPHHRKTLPVLIPLAFGLCLLPRDTLQVYKAVSWFSRLGIVSMFVMPSILYLAARLRGGKANVQA